jgi:thermitase
MQWTFDVLGRRTTLTRLPGVVAAHLGKGPRPKAQRRALLAALGTEIPPDYRGGPFRFRQPFREATQFRKAGWVFLQVGLETEQAASLRQRAGGLVVAPVFLNEAGRLLLGTSWAVIRLRSSLSPRAAASRLRKAGRVEVYPLKFATNLFEVRLPPGVDLAEALRRLRKSLPEHRCIEPQLLEVIPGRLCPNDPRYPSQWHHRNDGANSAPFGTINADIRSEGAWDITRGKGVRVAVIDFAFQIDHPNLQAGIVGGGFFQDRTPGRARFVPYLGRPAGPVPDDSHGTSCLGMAGGRMNNGFGGCGSAPEADLLPVACLDDEVGTQVTLARAVAYAANPRFEEAHPRTRGADVISCSLGPACGPWQLQCALDLALRYAAYRGRRGKGIPVFWSVYNTAEAIADDQISSHPGVIAVGASDPGDRRGDCAFGPKLAFLAPGEGVWTDTAATTLAQQFNIASGTSNAAPLAAGVAALVLSLHPHWTRRQVLHRLEQTCDKIGGPKVKYPHGRNDHYGHGRINAARAVHP